MEKPFTADLRELADGMGIGLYQRFTPTEASLFLRCPLKEITRLQADRQIEFIQVTENQTEFFGFQLLKHLLAGIRGVAVPSAPCGAMPDKIIRSKEVQELTGLSRTTIWRLERAGKFPARLALSAGSIGWRLADVQEWIKQA